MPALCSGAGSDHHARVITTSSSMALVGKIELDTIRDGPTRRKMSSEAMYSQTKLVRPLAFPSMPQFTSVSSGECYRRARDRPSVRRQRDCLDRR